MEVVSDLTHARRGSGHQYPPRPQRRRLRRVYRSRFDGGCGPGSRSVDVSRVVVLRQSSWRSARSQLSRTHQSPSGSPAFVVTRATARRLVGKPAGMQHASGRLAHSPTRPDKSRTTSRCEDATSSAQPACFFAATAGAEASKRDSVAKADSVRADSSRLCSSWKRTRQPGEVTQPQLRRSTASQRRIYEHRLRLSGRCRMVFGEGH